MNKRGVAVFAAVVAVSVAGLNASAAWNDPSTWAPVKAVKGWFTSETQNVLVVTGNYLRPLRLAQIAQEIGGQPVLVFARDGKAYLTEPGKAAEVFAAGEVAAKVKALAVKKVVVLGDAQYVPQACLDALGVAEPTILADADWAKNGTSLAEMLKMPALKKSYVQCLADIDEMLQRVASRTASTAPVPVEPTVPAGEVVSPEANQPAVVPAEPEVAPTPAAPAEPKAAPAPIRCPIEPIIKA